MKQDEKLNTTRHNKNQKYILSDLYIKTLTYEPSRTKKPAEPIINQHTYTFKKVRNIL